MAGRRSPVNMKVIPASFASNYLGFFDPLGILFFVIAFSYAWSRYPPSRLVKALSVLVVIVSAGIGYSLFEFIGNGLLNLPIVPRPRSGGLGFIAIVDTLTSGLRDAAGTGQARSGGSTWAFHLA